MASFHNSFNGVAQHSDLLLEWDPVDAMGQPLVIHARLLNVTGDYKVNTFETDISSEFAPPEKGLCVVDNNAAGLTGDSFLWKDLPSPLPFLPTATYELQVLRQGQVGDIFSDLVIASSTPFAVSTEDRSGNNGGDWQTVGYFIEFSPLAFIGLIGRRQGINGTPSEPSKPTVLPHSHGNPDSSAAIVPGLVVPLVVGISICVLLCMQRRRKRMLEERQKERETLVID
ncbi:hypothetical protein GQX73_g8031 [Xylaria multiplex]|uniref:Uncharacterized protein n=1 Tax=Xylaria multiplex TaxID=323545 RepID=A0A7C8MIJ7_9PEZI|nr:hypothetical protein GQX73_g8031 [Xylaria multiplex]